MKNDFFEIYGATARKDRIIILGDTHCILLFGFGKDDAEDETGYNWRKDYDHRPSKAELKADIEALINGLVAKKIREGMRYEGEPVWLSEENQLNFKSTPTFPARYKTGERDDGTPVYRTFATQHELDDFNHAVADYINHCLNEGWDEKDSVDYDSLVSENEK